MTFSQDLPRHSAVTLRDRLAAGELSAVTLAEACIARVYEREADIRAWAWFDPDHVLEQARACDARLRSGAAPGPLHGLPVGVKDIIDTAGIPTENGCPVDHGRVPEVDALVVTRLKEAGAILFGKTVTTELAFLQPNITRNPVDPAHTPGGSSSGSAAAVADGMVPLAIGTQTGGSVVRPASFCGVVGFKPSFQALPRDGVLMQSHSLDTVGVFARDPLGAELLAGVLGDIDMAAGGFSLRESPPKLAFVAPPGWHSADADLTAAFERLRTRLGTLCDMARLPAVFDDVVSQRAIINTAEMGHYYERYVASDDARQALGPQTRAAIEAGQGMAAPTYVAALACQQQLRPALAPLFARYDALICPAAPGAAPRGLGSTGDSIFNGLWTMAGTPAITLPLFKDTNGLPMGVQLVGQVGEDAKLLETAHWFWRWSGGQTI